MRKIRSVLLFFLPVVLLGFALPAQSQMASFSATLAPLHGGTGHCQASFTFDGLGAQLVYRIACDDLTGDPAAVHFSGPALSNVDRVAMVRSKPIIGTASLTDVEVILLKGGNLYIDVRTAAHPEGEIGARIVPR